MSIAAWKALHELIFKPHYWQKTRHGLAQPFATGPDRPAGRLPDSLEASPVPELVRVGDQ
jgi:hypothetical protein